MKKMRGPCDLALCALILFLFSSNFLFFYSLKKIKKTNRRKQKTGNETEKKKKNGGPWTRSMERVHGPGP